MNATNYQTAITHAAWRDVSHFGRFRVAGKDAVALLHHLTTADIKRLKTNASADATLISNKGRVLDWLSVFRLADGFLVLTSPNRREMFAPHARRFILFRQDVQIEDVSETTAMFGVFGPDASKVLSLLGGEISEADELQHINIDNVPLSLARTRRLPMSGFWVWSSDAAGLQRIVGQSEAPTVDAETYNVLRVESGIAAAGLELTENINPWEARLDDSISLNKGCYNGQEIIARLNTYQKVKQRLCGLTLESPLEMGTGAELSVDGRAAGFVTSSVLSPRFGPIALAYVRNDWEQPGQQLQLRAGESEQNAIVAALPFVA